MQLISKKMNFSLEREGVVTTATTMVLDRIQSHPKDDIVQCVWRQASTP